MLKESLKADVLLDCTGLFCPQPVIRTAARVKGMEAGQTLEVHATDPGFQIDLPAWCHSHNQEFLGMRREKQVFIGYVRLKTDSRSAPLVSKG
jgi:TusA-related sulfurtransferase